MGRNVKEKIGKYLTRQRQRKIGYGLLASLGAVVVFCTTYALILPAITMSNDPICGYEAHTHNESCWSLVTLDPDPELICTDWMEADVVYHTHDQLCYDAGGQLICPLQERALHQHDETCFIEEKELICGLEGIDEDLAAQLPESVITPSQPEQEPEDAAPAEPVHVHSEDCYTRVQGALICGLEESEGHFHSPECFELQPVEGAFKLVCGQEETPFVEAPFVEAPALEDDFTDLTGFNDLTGYGGGHVHTDACYEPEMEDALVCDEAEGQGHVHTDECYEWTEELACGQEGIDEATAQALEFLARQQEEQQPQEPEEPEEPLHIHTAECYLVNLTQVCQEEAELHTHGPECYETRETFDELGNVTGTEEVLICTLPVAVEHQHTQDCIHYKVNQELSEAMELTCGMEVHVHTDACYIERELETDPYFCGFTAHAHNEDCYFESGELRCTMPEHEHTEECLDPSSAPEPEYPVDAIPGGDEPEYVCGIEEHTHDEEKCFVNGYLVCDTPEHVHDETCLAQEEPGEDGEPDGDGEILPGESDPQTIQFDNFTYNWETDDFQATLTVNGTATLSAEETEPSGEPQDGWTSPEASEPQDGWTGPEAGEPQDGWTSPEVSEPQDGWTGPEADEPQDGEDGTLFAEGGLSSYSAWDESGEVESGDDTWPEPPAGDGMDDSFTDDAGLSGFDPFQPSTPVSDLIQDGEIQLEVVPVTDTEDEDYQALKAKIEETVDEDTLIGEPQIVEIVATLNGQKLDLTGCQITVELKPVPELADQLEAASNISTMDLGDDDAPVNGDAPVDGDTTTDDDTNGEPSISVNVFTEDGEPQSKLMDAEEIRSGEASMSFTFTASRRAMYARAAAFKPNPDFRVQFYVNVRDPLVGKDDKGDDKFFLPFIDTSAEGNNGNATLPENGNMSPSLKYLHLDDKGVIQFEKKLTELYTEEKREFNPKLEDDLNVNYLNSLRSNENYELTALWLLKDGCDSESITESDWIIVEGDQKELNEKVTFTNNDEAITDETKFSEAGGKILISQNENTVIRLVYKEAILDAFEPDAMFFDYDISDGAAQTGTVKTMNTTSYGINDKANCNSDVKIAFGNGNTGTAYEENALDGGTLETSEGTKEIKYYFNQANGLSFGNCAFGLAQSSLVNGTIAFTVDAPDLFGDDDTGVVGKKRVTEINKLSFNRSGDTYTLTSVPGTGATNLENFGFQRDNWNKTKKIWSNNFWPMDKASTWGAAGHDFKFGDPNQESNRKYNGTRGGTLPVSDFGTDHNAYFGMKFAVDFRVVEEYVGPLEYYFYGDDDMWVYLSQVDGEGKIIDSTSQLICDIGGVHSSVGEYVNIWDYITGGKEGHANGTYRMSVFYTERGASGSTCWMQFTLPEISDVKNTPYEPGNAGLRIKKEVNSVTPEHLEMEFEFRVELTGVSNKYIMQRYAADGSKIGEPMEVTDVSYTKEETTFKLKNGEYMDIEELPAGTHYLIEELYSDDQCQTSVDNNGTIKKSVLAEGTITGNLNSEGVMIVDTATVTYTNSFLYSLPETGGPTTIAYTLGGALLAAAGCLVYKKKSERRGAADKT